MCLFKLCCLLKYFLHKSQAYGHSPLWICRCTVRLFCRVKNFLQMLHWYGCYLVCRRMCTLCPLFRLKDLLHTPHLYGCWCTCEWVLREFCWLKNSLQALQVYWCPVEQVCCCLCITCGSSSKVSLVSAHSFVLVFSVCSSLPVPAGSISSVTITLCEKNTNSLIHEQQNLSLEESLLSTQ